MYVDVGECTDAIQHKDRGDFQVTGTLQCTCVEFAFPLHVLLQHVRDLKG